MPIEIRELIIKTEIRTENSSRNRKISKEEMRLLKKQVLEECRRMISENAKRKTYKR